MARLISLGSSSYTRRKTRIWMCCCVTESKRACRVSSQMRMKKVLLVHSAKRSAFANPLGYSGKPNSGGCPFATPSISTSHSSDKLCHTGAQLSRPRCQLLCKQHYINRTWNCTELKLKSINLKPISTTSPFLASDGCSPKNCLVSNK